CGTGKRTVYFPARSILYPAYTGERIAYLVIGIDQKVIRAILTKNDTGADFIRVCTGKRRKMYLPLTGSTHPV
ncbi:MAG: hypothetical protein LBB83_03915, partial [Treponema sp.]|nr:hypothetical protein [Treponema sp.]